MEGVEVDRGWAVVANAGGFAGFLDAVVVVPGPFHGARAGPLATFRDEQGRDPCQVVREGVSPVLRGECPPSR